MSRIRLKHILFLGVYVFIEIVLYLLYDKYDALFHWLTHYFIGAIFALVIMSIVAGRTKKPIRLPLLWILLGHIVAMFPDILFSVFKIAHESWMNVFLFHIDGHFIAGQNTTWYVLFLLSVAIYLYVIYKLYPSDTTKPD